MLRSLKHLLRDRVPYSLLLRVYYERYRRIHLPLYEQACSKAEFQRLEAFDLSQVKKSPVLFVLGSGASINQISAERWAGISAHDSVGFNFWLFHPFVPKMYFFESTGGSAPTEHDRRHVEALLRRAADYEGTVKVVMDLAQAGHQYIFDLPAEFRHSVYAAGTVPLIARNREELAKGIGHLLDQGEFTCSDHLASLLKVTGTLTTMITLGVRMGYRTIVLCGVDLNSAEYFYQDPVLYPDTADFHYMPRNGKHLTLTKYAWGVMPIDEVILEIKRQVLDPAGVELYVENRSSALWPRIEQAPDSVFAIAADRAKPAAGPSGLTARVL